MIILLCKMDSSKLPPTKIRGKSKAKSKGAPAKSGAAAGKGRALKRTRGGDVDDHERMTDL